MSTDAEQKMEIRITRIEDKVCSMEKELVDLREIQSDIRSINISINTLTGELKHLVDNVCKTIQRVDNIENKPARRWDMFVQGIIMAATGGLIGYMIAMILK